MPHTNNHQQQTPRYLLFTGHMIDKPGRKQPRFPASKEGAAREAIKEKVSVEINKLGKGQPLAGIAGGACGGDILFHEVCGEEAIPTQIYLALPVEQFINESVAFGGNGWVERFNRLLDKLPHTVLAERLGFAESPQGQPAGNVWSETNLWMLDSATANGGSSVTLIALWDGKGGDGAGGTEDMVKKASERGAKTIIIDINRL